MSMLTFYHIFPHEKNLCGSSRDLLNSIHGIFKLHCGENEHRLWIKSRNRTSMYMNSKMTVIQMSFGADFLRKIHIQKHKSLNDRTRVVELW